MQINIQSLHFTAQPALIELIEEKLGKVIAPIDRVTSCDVYLRLDKNDAKKNKIVEIKIDVPRNQFFATGRSDSFEKAAAECIIAMRKQVETYHEQLKETKAGKKPAELLGE